MRLKSNNMLLMTAFAIVIFLSGTLPVYASDVLEQAADTSVSDSEVSIYQIEDNAQISTLLSGGQNTGPILKDVRTVEQGRQTLIIKTWDVPPGYDTELLVEDDFEKGGLQYKRAYLLQVSENYDTQHKLASETVTVSHENKSDAIARLQPIIEYSTDGYTGQLTLQADAIVTEAADINSYSYAVTDTREYSGLERNDTYNIPKSVDKNGVSLQLVDVNWTQMGEGNYKALASYSGSATGTSVSGYISTATYIGEVAKSELESVTYAVVYEGTVIPTPPFDFSPYLLAGIGTVVILAFVAILLSRRDNTKVYAMIGKEYQLVHKQKVTSLAPIIDLSPREISDNSDEFMIVLDRLTIRKMRGHSIKIIGKDGIMKEQRVFKVRHFHIGHGFEEGYDYEQ